MSIRNPISIISLILLASCSSKSDDFYDKIERISYKFDDSDENGSIYIIDNMRKTALLLDEVYTYRRPYIDYGGDSIDGSILKSTSVENGQIKVDLYKFRISNSFKLKECEFSVEGGKIEINQIIRGDSYEIENMIEENRITIDQSKCVDKELKSDDGIIWYVKEDLR